MTDTHALGQEKTSKRGKQIRKERSEWIGVKIPAIISKELFNKANAKLQYNRECYRNAQRTQLLSNLVYCGKCDSRCYAYRRHYVVERKNGKRLYQKAVYRCRVKGIGHNPEIDTRIIESSVIEMITSIMLDKNKLKEFIDLHKKGEANRQRIENQLQDTKEKIESVANQKQRILDLYASGELEREEYVKRVRTYESEISKLQIKNSELLNWMPLFQKPEIIEDGIAEYCRRTKKQFSQCDDFNSKRKFCLDHIKKVSYIKNATNDKIQLNGTVPIKLENQSSTVPLEFKIERIVNRKELLKQARELSLKIGAWGGTQVFAKEYGKLVMAKTPEVQP